ncbi:MAG: N-6 DNA methylase, partial [Desulfobacterales bacterium]|nr:N-6 DNA methylase [Desulfobacterales bacterium]
QIGLMHEKNVSDKVKIIECYIARAPFELNGQMVRKGSWVMVLKIEDDSIKQDIKDGKLTGLSMSGTATNMAA